MKKTLRILIIFILLISCGKKEDRVTIQFWAFGGTTNLMKWSKERVAEFNASQPYQLVETRLKNL